MLEVIVAGRAGVAASAEGVVANVTVTEPGGPGYVTVYLCGQAFPLASNVNFSGGQTVANLVLTGIGSGGSIRLFSSVAAHLVVDVTGWMPAGSVLKTISPQRLGQHRLGAPHGSPVPLAGQLLPQRLLRRRPNHRGGPQALRDDRVGQRVGLVQPAQDHPWLRVRGGRHRPDPDELIDSRDRRGWCR